MSMITADLWVIARDVLELPLTNPADIRTEFVRRACVEFDTTYHLLTEYLESENDSLDQILFDAESFRLAEAQAAVGTAPEEWL